MPSILLLLLLLLLLTSSAVMAVVDGNKLDDSSSSAAAAAAAATATATATKTSESKPLQQQQQLRRRRRRQRRVVETLDSEIVEPDQKVKKMNRIVGGENVQPTNRYPWFARVIGNKLDNSDGGGGGGGGGVDACGGSLIAPDLVLTAAHCTEPTKIYLSVYDLDNKPYDGIDVIANVRHPLYGTGDYSIDYDIMISQLATPVSSDIVQPIRLNFDNNYPNEEESSDEGLDLTMIGFGSIIGGPETGLANPPNQQSSLLQSASTNYVPLATCAIAKDPNTGVVYGVNWPKRTSVKENWFCTVDEVTSTCFGDSGGPIMKENYFDFNRNSNSNSNSNSDSDSNIDNQDNNNDLLLAVISGTSGYCGNEHLPLWNSRVSFHKEWILYWGCNLSNGSSNTAPKEWNCIPTPTGIDGNSTNVPIDNNVYYLDLDLDTNGIITDITDAPIITTITTEPTSTTTIQIITTNPTDLPSSKPVTAITTNAPTSIIVVIEDDDDDEATTNEPTAVPTLLIMTTTSEPTTPTPMPTIAAPIAAPIAAALTLSPTAVTSTTTASPTKVAPTNSPPITKEPTPVPKTLSPTTLKPNPFPIPIQDDSTTSPPPPQDDDEEGSDDNNDGDDDEDEVVFVCPICGDDELMISNPDAIVFVPVLGQKTCQELVTAATQGKIDKGGECVSIQITVPSVCDCIPLKQKQPIIPITSIIPIPTLKPTTILLPNTTPAPTIPTLKPTIPTLKPTILPNTTPAPTIPTWKPLPNPPAPTIPTCDAIKYKDDYNLNSVDDVIIDFYFDNSSAQYIGWYITDSPKEECFRIGTPSGNYYGRTKQVSLISSLIENVEYKFVLQVNDNGNTDEPISGSYNITAGDYLLVSSGNVIFNDGDTTIFTTPQL